MLLKKNEIKTNEINITRLIYIITFNVKMKQLIML